MNRLLLLGLLPFVALAACATAPDTAPMFSKDALPPPDPGYGVIVVYRAVVAPLAYKPTVSVNGEEAVELPNKAFSWIKVKPGHVAVKNDWSFASGNPSGEVDWDAEAGHYYYIEVTGDTAPQNLTPFTIAAHVIGNTATFHNGVQGRGFIPEDDATAVDRLTKCCRYVPVEDDYVPPVPIPDAHPETAGP